MSEEEVAEVAAKVVSEVAAKVAGSTLDRSLCLAVLGYATASALLSEAFAWYMIYRTSDYHRLKNNLDKANKRLDKKKLEEPVAVLKSTTVGTKAAKGKDKKGNESKQDKKLTMLEKEVESTNRDLTLFKMKTNMATMMMHLFTFYALKTQYEGIVVARLPFEPFAMIRGLSHRGISGDDYRECGVILIYVLCSMAIKPNLQRALGHAPPKTAMPKSIWGIPIPQPQ